MYPAIELWPRRFVNIWRQGGAANILKIGVNLRRRPFFGQEIAYIKTIRQLIVLFNCSFN